MAGEAGGPKDPPPPTGVESPKIPPTPPGGGGGGGARGRGEGGEGLGSGGSHRKGVEVQILSRPRAVSSVGRATHLHCEGRGFESLTAHCFA